MTPLPRIAAFLHRFKVRARGLFRRRSQENELNRELQFHFDMLVQENLASGMSPTEARLAAQREFGTSSVYREECRDTWRPAFLTGLLNDFTFAWRGLRRSPGFTIVAVFTLALGIGVNATIFSFIREGILQPLVRDRQLNLVALYNARVGTDSNFRGFSYPELRALRESGGVFTDIAAQAFTVAAVGRKYDLQRRFICFASENFFSVLGARPYQGRFFTDEESQPGASIPVMVANHALWERLGRPADFVGSTMRVNRRDYTVVGIAPPGFVGVNISLGPDAWLPLGEFGNLTGKDLLHPSSTSFGLLARLQPALSLDAARHRLDAADRQLNTVPSLDNAGPRRLVIAAPPRSELGSSRPTDEGYLSVFAAVALGLSLLVLLVACLNLANMLLARGSARQKEIAIRLALGASRWRVIRALLSEGLLLALAGGTLGLVFSFWSDRVLIQWSETAFNSGLFALGWSSFFDPSIVLATLAFSLFATVIFSLWPALRVTRLDLNHDLKQVPGNGATPVRWSRLLSPGSASIILQIALSLALVFSAALFVRSSREALTLDLGFQTSDQLVANIDYSFLELDPVETRLRQQALLAAVERLPGVESAALAGNVPYSFGLAWRPIRPIDGNGEAVSVSPTAAPQWSGYTAVTQDYFSTLGISLIRGRDFTFEESSGSGATRPVAIVDETLAYRLFGDADPIGRRISIGGTVTVGEGLEVVGVARRFRNDVFETHPPPRIFRPYGQVDESTAYIHVRTEQPLALVDSVRRALREADPAAPVLSVRPLSVYVEQHINMLLIRVAGVVFGLFGLIALVLAVVGVYGVKAYAVVRRTREIGVRMALGARPRDVMMLVLKQGAVQTALGVAFGLLLALGAGRIVSGMLYSVDPFDPIAILVGAALLSTSALLACWLPARRASKVDPIQTLRAE